jgi:hypothetical protein
MAVIATAMATVGFGFGAGTAQAKPRPPHPPPHPVVINTSPVFPMGSPVSTFNQRADNFFDGVQGLFGVGQGTPFDNRIDAFFGVK